MIWSILCPNCGEVEIAKNNFPIKSDEINGHKNMSVAKKFAKSTWYCFVAVL